LFLNRLDRILNSLYKVDLKFIICGDININYLADSDETRQLDAVLLSYNLPSIVNFPTRTQNKSSTAIDNIFIDTYKITDSTLFPLISGLSDHDTQLLIIMDLSLQVQGYFIYNVRNVNKYSIEKFKIGLSCAYWNCAFGNNDNMDVDSLLNAFLNNYLRIFYTRPPPPKKKK
jgi:hypothetical protein